MLLITNRIPSAWMQWSISDYSSFYRAHGTQFHNSLQISDAIQAVIHITHQDIFPENVNKYIKEVSPAGDHTILLMTSTLHFLPHVKKK